MNEELIRFIIIIVAKVFHDAIITDYIKIIINVRKY